MRSQVSILFWGSDHIFHATIYRKGSVILKQVYSNHNPLNYQLASLGCMLPLPFLKASLDPDAMFLQAQDVCLRYRSLSTNLEHHFLF